MTNNIQYFASLHAFRGFAIINIVAIHAIEFIFHFTSTAQVKANLTAYAWTESILLHDSTLYFTFISGILFSLVLVDRGYVRFYKSKLINVFLPYLFFTVFITWRDWRLANDSPSYFDAGFLNFLNAVSKNLITGGAIFSFWYIPVLLALYIATPLLSRLLSIKRAKWLVVMIILAPLITSRVWPQMSWTTFAYFLGAYLLGMFVGKNYQQTISYIQTNATKFMIVAIIATATLYGLFYFDNPNLGITNVKESVWYIQKITIAGLVILLFEKSIVEVPQWLKILADYSFAIYFLHAYLIYEVISVLKKTLMPPTSTPIILSLALTNVVLILALSIVITHLTKLLFRKYSRYIVGA